MPTILQGNFHHFPAGELLPILASNGHTGTLDVTTPRGSIRVFVQEGVIVHAEASHDSKRADEILCDLFVFGGEAFTFDSEVVLPAGSAPAPVDLRAVLETGRRRAEEWQRLLAIYPSHDIVVRVIDPSKTPADISLSAEEFTTLMKIGGGRKLAQLTIDLQKPAPAVYDVVHRLESKRLVERIRETESALSSAATEVTPMPPMATLTSLAGESFPLVGDTHVIGRDEKADFRIDDPTVSNVHARVVRTDSDYAIEDAQSRNGTFVNGEAVKTRNVLADGDTIRLGKVILTFNIAAGPRQGAVPQRG